MGKESGNWNDQHKMTDKVHHAMYRLDIGCILQHNVSLQHCLDPFARTIKTL